MAGIVLQVALRIRPLWYRSGFNFSLWSRSGSDYLTRIRILTGTVSTWFSLSVCPLWPTSRHTLLNFALQLPLLASLEHDICRTGNESDTGNDKDPNVSGSASIIEGNKKRLYRLSKSQNKCTEKPPLIGNLVTCSEVQLGGVKPSWDRWMCRFDCPYPPPPSTWFTFLSCIESYIYWVLRNNFSVISGAVQCFGSESGSSWIRIHFGPGSGIRIRIRNPDPDSGSRCLKIGLKSQNLLWLTLIL